MVMDDNLQELHDGLVAWWLGSAVPGADLHEVWEDAFRRYDNRLGRILDAAGGDENAVLDSPKELLIECFSSSLSDHEQALSAFVQALPCGWEDLLRSAVDQILTRPAGYGPAGYGLMGDRSTAEPRSAAAPPAGTTPGPSPDHRCVG